MTPKLSPCTKQLVEFFFQEKDIVESARCLEEECGNNLPFCDHNNEHEMERIRFAAIKLSKGNLLNLRKAIDLARMDWRELLMAADFGYDIRAHEAWARDILRGL